MIWTHAAAAVVAAFATLVVMQLRIDSIEGRHKAELANLKTDAAEQRTRAAASALHTYALMESTKNAAIEDASARAAKNQADADGLRRQLGSMRNDLATVPDRISTASRASVDEFAATSAVVFEQCVGRYAALAQLADQHANDAAACHAAWPVNPPRPDAGI